MAFNYQQYELKNAENVPNLNTEYARSPETQTLNSTAIQNNPDYAQMLSGLRQMNDSRQNYFNNLLKIERGNLQDRRMKAAIAEAEEREKARIADDRAWTIKLFNIKNAAENARANQKLALENQIAQQKEDKERENLNKQGKLVYDLAKSSANLPNILPITTNFRGVGSDVYEEASKKLVNDYNNQEDNLDYSLFAREGGSELANSILKNKAKEINDINKQLISNSQASNNQYYRKMFLPNSGQLSARGLAFIDKNNLRFLPKDSLEGKVALDSAINAGYDPDKLEVLANPDLSQVVFRDRTSGEVFDVTDDGKIKSMYSPNDLSEKFGNFLDNLALNNRKSRLNGANTEMKEWY